MNTLSIFINIFHIRVYWIPFYAYKVMAEYTIERV